MIPLQDFVLIEEILLNKQVGELVLPEGVDEEPTNQGIIKAVGSKVTLPVYVENKVLIKKYCFDEITIEGKRYLIGRQEGVMMLL